MAVLLSAVLGQILERIVASKKGNYFEKVDPTNEGEAALGDSFTMLWCLSCKCQPRSRLYVCDLVLLDQGSDFHLFT